MRNQSDNSHLEIASRITHYEGKPISDMQWNETRNALGKMYKHIHLCKAEAKRNPTPEAMAELVSAKALNAALNRHLSRLNDTHQRDRYGFVR